MAVNWGMAAVREKAAEAKMMNRQQVSIFQIRTEILGNFSAQR